MKNNQKLALKIISVFAALVLWLFVTYTEDALIDINVNSIVIEFIGEQSLLSKNLAVVDKQSVPEASVRIRGRRGDLIAVMDGVRAKVDVSQITSAGTYELTPSFDIPSSAVYVSKRNTLSVEVKVVKMIEKTVDVVVVQENADKNKAYVIESIPKIDEIKIRGEANDISQIGRAALYVDVASITEPTNYMINVVYETLAGEKVNLKNEVYSDVSVINVENKLHTKKTVDVLVGIPVSTNENYSVKLLSQSINKIDIGIIDDEADVESVTANPERKQELVLGNNKCTLKIDVPDGVYIPEDKLTIEADYEVSRREVIQ